MSVLGYAAVATSAFPLALALIATYEIDGDLYFSLPLTILVVIISIVISFVTIDRTTRAQWAWRKVG